MNKIKFNPFGLMEDLMEPFSFRNGSRFEDGFKDFGEEIENQLNGNSLIFIIRHALVHQKNGDYI